MHKCSHRVKSKTVAELLKIALIRSDKRRAACAWELCICYFSGFGVEKDWMESRHWLTEASVMGVTTAQAIYVRLHDAMGYDPMDTLVTFRSRLADGTEMQPYRREDATGLVCEWLGHAVSAGSVDIIHDLRRFQQANDGLDTFDPMAMLRTTSGASTSSPYDAQILLAAVSGDLQMVKSAVGSKLECIEEVDSSGNNAVILAAKFGNLAILRFLL